MFKQPKSKTVLADPKSFIKGELSCPEFPTRIRTLKGINFNPEVVLNSKQLYFIAVSVRHNYSPAPGFYDVPNKGYVTWIGRFDVVAVSNPLRIGTVDHVAYVFKAIEDNPPLGLMPNMPKNNTPPGIIY